MAPGGSAGRPISSYNDITILEPAVSMSEQGDLSETPSSSVASSSTKKRKETRGKGLEKINEVAEKIVIDIPSDKGRPIDPVKSTKLSSEIDIVAWKFIPVLPKWNKLSDDLKKVGWERLNIRFQIQLNDENVKKNCEQLLSRQSKNQRHKLHKL